MQYGLWLFDCDGVILDSNSLKTDAFHRIGMGYGPEDARALVRYHLENGGVSRFEKLSYFFRDIRGEIDYQKKLRAALAEYGEFVKAGLRRCLEVPGIRAFLKKLRETEGLRAFVISGSEEEELRQVFSERGLASYFDGIFGSPAKKRDIVSELCSLERRPGSDLRAVFCGDSRLDYEVARAFGIDFIMIHGYTEWEDWQKTIPGEIICARDFDELTRREEVLG